MLQVAWSNKGWCFENFVIRQIESKRGRTAARRALGFGGSAMILIGAWTLVAPIALNDVDENSDRSDTAPIFENQ